MYQLKQVREMKKLTWIMAALLCVSLWSCSEDENPAGEEQKEDVVISFEGELSEPNSSFLATEGEEDGFYMKTAFSDPQIPRMLCLLHIISAIGASEEDSPIPMGQIRLHRDMPT